MMASKSFVFHFDDIEVREREFTLIKAGKVLTVEPKAFRALLFLLHNPQRLISKEELLNTVWGDAAVTEGSLTRCIWLLRSRLGDDIHEPRYIETVATVGYRFVCPVEASEDGSGKDEEASIPIDQGVAPADPPHKELSRRRVWWAIGGVAMVGSVVAIAVVVALRMRSPTRAPDRSQWVQLTKLPDSVTEPALSPDGRMLAFIRGDSTFVGAGQVYVKILPDGEPVQLTHDNVLKMDPTFSPDGSRVAYTTVDPQFHWDTWVVPTLGGEPQPLLRNASGLVWTGPRQVLFSEIKMGMHMGIVAGAESRIGARDIYLPEDEPAMAHRSYLSPDGKWVLLVEMDHDHDWLPCRLVPTDGSSRGRHVGPLGGGCTVAAWSHDGKWMYFTANPGGVNHIWRQRFPDGQPEQITSGPTEEEGVAMAPDGRSFVTAVALQNTSLWVHDAKGEHQISLEGNVAEAKFTPDGKKLCYLIVREAPFASYGYQGELRTADMESGRSEPLVSGLPVLDYDISADGQQVVMWTTDPEGKPRLWVARLDRSSSPAQIPNVEGRSPLFGPSGDIFFRHLEGTSTFVYRVQPNGTGLQKVRAEPVLFLHSVSPDGRWIVGWALLPGNGPPSVQAFPLDGGPPIQIGLFRFVSWSLDDRSMFSMGAIFSRVVISFHCRRGRLYHKSPQEDFIPKRK